MPCTCEHTDGKKCGYCRTAPARAAAQERMKTAGPSVRQQANLAKGRAKMLDNRVRRKDVREGRPIDPPAEPTPAAASDDLPVGLDLVDAPWPQAKRQPKAPQPTPQPDPTPGVEPEPEPAVDPPVPARELHVQQPTHKPAKRTTLKDYIFGGFGYDA